MRNFNKLCMFCGGAFLAMNLLGCGITQNGEKILVRRKLQRRRQRMQGAVLLVGEDAFTHLLEH